MARSLLLPLLPVEPVQAQRPAQRAESVRRRRALPAGRLARAERRDGGAVAGRIEAGVRRLTINAAALRGIACWSRCGRHWAGNAAPASAARRTRTAAGRRLGSEADAPRRPPPPAPPDGG